MFYLGKDRFLLYFRFHSVKVDRRKKNNFLKERCMNIIHYVPSSTRQHEIEQYKTEVLSAAFLCPMSSVFCSTERIMVRFLVCTIAYNPPVQHLCGLEVIAL